MIEINLLPGGRKSKRRGTGTDFRAVLAGGAARVRDPFLVAALLCLVAGGGAIAWMFTSQRAEASELAERIEQAQRDSTRFAAVIGERHHAEAQRDSVKRTLALIRTIDDDRYVWAHVLDEVSRSLPPYTWLKSVSQLVPAQPAVAQAAPRPAGKDAKDDKSKPDADSLDAPAPTRVRIVGHTVDIQALTRFMKELELSPFVQNVQLARSELVVAEGKEVTEFTLDAEYQRPDASAVRTVAVTLPVR
jgi:Tfp pilus assembly protein PilN